MRRGHVKATQYLLEQGCDPFHKDIDGQDSFARAGTHKVHSTAVLCEYAYELTIRWQLQQVMSILKAYVKQQKGRGAPAKKTVNFAPQQP